MKKLLALFLLTSTVLLGACGKGSEQVAEESQDLQVITTFYPMYEFTKEVVGDTGKVSLLIPAGTEPHDYEPSAKDMAKIMDADAFVYNSPELETWVPTMTDSIDTDKTVVIEAAKEID